MTAAARQREIMARIALREDRRLPLLVRAFERDPARSHDVVARAAHPRVVGRRRHLLVEARAMPRGFRRVGDSTTHNVVERELESVVVVVDDLRDVMTEVAGHAARRGWQLGGSKSFRR